MRDREPVVLQLELDPAQLTIRPKRTRELVRELRLPRRQLTTIDPLPIHTAKRTPH